MNNPNIANDGDDVSLVSLNFGDILKDELSTKSIFAVERMNTRQKKKSAKKVKETMKVQKEKHKKKHKDLLSDIVPLGNSSPEPSTSIGKRVDKVELKMTNTLPILIKPIFRFIKDN